MKTLILSVGAIALAVVASAAQVTYTWKGGAGNWSDPAMWTASDGSTDKYPCDDLLDTAEFPAGVTATVTIPDGTTVSNLYILTENSNVKFVATEGCTNSMTYRALRAYDASTKKYISSCGPNAAFALDRVKLYLKIGTTTPRLFTASTANQPDIQVRVLDGPKAGSTVLLENGSYFSVLSNSAGSDLTWDIRSGSEYHTMSFHMGNGSTVSLSNAYLTTWYGYTDSWKFSDGNKFVFRGDHPRFIYGRIGSSYIFCTTWDSRAPKPDGSGFGAQVENVATLEYHLPIVPYAYAPFSNDGNGTTGFPGGGFTRSDSGEKSIAILDDNVKVVIAKDSPVRQADVPGSGLKFNLIDWSGMSWKKLHFGIDGLEKVLVEGLKSRESVYIETREGWEDANLPQIFGATILPKSGLAILIK